MPIQTQEAFRTSNIQVQKRISLSHITIRTLNTQDKGSILNVLIVIYNGRANSAAAPYSTETLNFQEGLGQYI